VWRAPGGDREREYACAVDPRGDPMHDVGHRPWPLPRGPWVMAQQWHDLLFAHWQVPAETIRPLVPPSLPLDLLDGAAWLGIVPFRVAGMRARFLPPVPFLSSFPELNVRTYVRLGKKPGIYFFSLDAGNRLAAWGGRMLYRLEYFHARMSARRAGGRIAYASRRADDPRAEFAATYGPTGTVATAVPGTLDHWLTERYCLYTVALGGRVLRAEIHHPPWPLQPAEADFTLNSMTAPLGLALPGAAPLLHFARHQDVRIWAPQLVAAAGTRSAAAHRARACTR
jgi:uncharacterized protein YqjF (DUF2071 family)